MSPETRTEVAQILETSRQDLHAAAAGLSESQAKAKPGPDRWSVLDCLEHVTVVEGRFYGWLEQAKRLDAPRVDKGKEAQMAARVVDRSNRAEAPEAARPTGRFATVAEALKEFDAARARTVAFLEARSADLYAMEVTHPRFGAMNAAEFVRIIAGHTQRHAAQMREALTALGA